MIDQPAMLIRRFGPRMAVNDHDSSRSRNPEIVALLRTQRRRQDDDAADDGAA